MFGTGSDSRKFSAKHQRLPVRNFRQDLVLPDGRRLRVAHLRADLLPLEAGGREPPGLRQKVSPDVVGRPSTLADVRPTQVRSRRPVELFELEEVLLPAEASERSMALQTAGDGCRLSSG